MRHKFISLLLFLSFLAMSLSGGYWQQYVEYNMDIYLDAEQKTLQATSELLYVNHSPDTLNKILMHLYPNAFNAGTIAEQVWSEDGQTFDLEKGWTGIQIQKATCDSMVFPFRVRDDTILEIELSQPLRPGDSLGFSLEWLSTIHPHIDRSGWEGNQFDFTQWYPKFVVYDEHGWHDDPFGDWGEFYGEFGKYTLNLDIPSSQIVAATGVVFKGDPGWASVSVDTSREWNDWVKEFRDERETYLTNLDSAARRKVSFLAENVHDFAWSCSENYVYEHGHWNGIDVHVLFDPSVGEDWTRDVVKWGQNSLEWLSEKFGMYTWPQITIVHGLLSGGMEYPMLVMDSYDSESLAVHEIGHNWFYGILGNDELDDAWLDEGLTTFQTRWYLESHYPENDYYLSRDYITQFEYDNLPLQNVQENELKRTISYTLSPANEPIATHSFDFQAYNSYNYNAYEKPAFMLDVLKNYLGEERFLAGMRLYFSRWALKHVNEERFIQAMEEGCGEELDWFFDQWLHATNWVDYQLNDWSVERVDQDLFKTQIKVDNKGGMFVPITATIYSKTGEKASDTLKEFRYRNSGIIEVESQFYPNRVYLDAENVFMDVDRRDNQSQLKLAFRYDYKEWEEYPDDRNLFLWKPMFGYNDADGLGLGISIRRVYRIPGNFLQFTLDENLGSGNLDAALSFKKVQVGMPFKGTWSGLAQSWRSLVFASLSYELNWARTFWRNPLHFLTLKIESTDAKNAAVSPSDQIGMTRFGLVYELQDKLFSGNLGFTSAIYTSPAELGNYGTDFNQLSLMGSWSKSFAIFHLKNRSNFLANSQNTPDLIKSRVASKDLRSVYLDRGARSLYGIDDAKMIGSHYYLRGGGRMRAYTDSLDKPMNYIWSNNLDLIFKAIPHVPKLLDVGVFLDFGQISNTGRNWMNVGDLGLALEFKPKWKRRSWISTWFRPFHVKFEWSILRYEDEAWISTYDSNQWLFSISN